jgi:hypothetical protein
MKTFKEFGMLFVLIVVMTIREAAQEVRICKTTCHEFRTENLGMHLVATVYMFYLLIEDRKQSC